MRPNSVQITSSPYIFPLDWSMGTHSISITPNAATVNVFYTRQLPEDGDFSSVTTWIEIGDLTGITAPANENIGPATALKIEVTGTSAQLDVISVKYASFGASISDSSELTLSGVPENSVLYNSGNTITGDSSFVYDPNTETLTVPNFVTTGTATSIETTNYDVVDSIIGLALYNVTDALDIGWVGTRASSNIAHFWDESNDEFALAFTLDDPDSTSITIDDYADLHLGKLHVEDSIGAGIDPAYKLHVYGGASGLAATVGRFQSVTGNLDIVCSDLSATNPTWGIVTALNESIQLSPGGIVAVHIDATSGRIGFNETSPDDDFHFLAKSGSAGLMTEALTGGAYNVLSAGNGLFDAGIIVNRSAGLGGNVAMIWDESEDEFAFASVSTNSSNSAQTVTNYANLRAGILFSDYVSTSDQVIGGTLAIGSSGPTGGNVFEVVGNARTIGNQAVTGTLNVTGVGIFNNTLTVGGLATLNNGLNVTGNTNLGLTLINSVNTGTDSLLDITGTDGKHALITGNDGSSNGFTLLGGRISNTETGGSLGVSHSGAGFVMSNFCKVSDTTDNVYLSSIGAFPVARTAFKLDSDGSFKWLSAASATVAVDSPVTMTQLMSLSSTGLSVTGNGYFSGNLGIGVTTALSPLHLRVGSSVVAPIAGTNLTLENSTGAARISILNQSTTQGQIIFGNELNNINAIFLYNHTAQVYNWTLNGNVNKMTLSGSGLALVNQLLASAGTVSLPSIAASGDTNTGWYFPAADTLAAVTGGAEAMRIDSSQNVGIGITPSSKLHVEGVLRISNGSDYGTITRSATALEIQSYNSEPISLNPAGNDVIMAGSGSKLGIGTSSPNANAILDLTSTTRAFMPPRMTTTQRDAIASPTAGMVIYNTTTNVLNFYNGTTWGAV